MIRTQYWNPADDSAVTGQLVSEAELRNLFDKILGLSSRRGHPALELVRKDGSSLVIATRGSRCVLSWVNPLEESFHSVGGATGPILVFDYFGSWSEVPAEFTIATCEALECAGRFILNGSLMAIQSSSSQTKPHPLLPLRVRDVESTIMVDMEAIVRLQEQRCCASITCMIRDCVSSKGEGDLRSPTHAADDRTTSPALPHQQARARQNADLHRVRFTSSSRRRSLRLNPRRITRRL